MSSTENDDENIEEDEESPEITEKDSFSCPHCEGEVEHLIHRGYGWVKCPRCDKGIRRVDIPKKYHYLIKKVPDYKPKESKKEEIHIPPSEPKEGKADMDRIPFDRAQEHWQVLQGILSSFGVNERALSLIVARAQRQKQPIHPSEVQRLLAAFKSGLKKDELSYVAEEYYLALESERKHRKEMTSSRSQYYPRYDEEDEDEEDRGFYSPKGDRDYDDSIPAWDRGKRGMVSISEVKRMLHEEKKNDQIRDMSKEIHELQNMVGQVLNNPPPDNKKDDFYQMMMEQQERADRERQRAHEARLASDQRAHEERIESMKREQGARDIYTEKLLDLTREATKQPIKANTDGFQEDGPRVLAQAITSASQVIRDGKPIKQIIDGAQAISKVSQPPEPVDIDRSGDKEKVGILSSIDDDLIDDE